MLLTGDLFDRPQRSDVFVEQTEDIFLYRHLFKHETPKGTGHEKLQISNFDKRTELSRKKLAVYKKVRNQIKRPTQQVIETILKDGNETRYAITNLQNEMAKQNALLLEQIRTPMTKIHAKELVRKSLGFNILEHLDIKTTPVENKPISYFCNDLESSSLVIGFDDHRSGIYKFFVSYIFALFGCTW